MALPVQQLPTKAARICQTHWILVIKQLFEWNCINNVRQYYIRQTFLVQRCKLRCYVTLPGFHSPSAPTVINTAIIHNFDSRILNGWDGQIGDPCCLIHAMRRSRHQFGMRSCHRWLVRYLRSFIKGWEGVGLFRMPASWVIKLKLPNKSG